MKLVNASVEIVDQGLNPKDLVNHISVCGRTCYQSEHREEKASTFVGGIIKRGHESVVEHAHLILKVPLDVYMGLAIHGFPRMRFSQNDVSLVSGNVRTFRDFCKKYGEYRSVQELTRALASMFPTFFGNLEHPIDTEFISIDLVDVKTLKFQEQFLHGAMTVKVITNRGVSHEIVRMRDSTFSQESSRYCNYGKGKYGNEVTFIQPLWFSRDLTTHPKINGCVVNENEGALDCLEVENTCGEVDHVFFWDDKEQTFFENCLMSEKHYLKYLELGLKPGQARGALNHEVKTEMFWTSPLFHWNWIFHERCVKVAHEQFREVSLPLLKMAMKEYPNVFDCYAEDHRHGVSPNLLNAWKEASVTANI